jgi:hypothetical protein
MRLAGIPSQLAAGRAEEAQVHAKQRREGTRITGHPAAGRAAASFYYQASPFLRLDPWVCANIDLGYYLH